MAPDPDPGPDAQPPPPAAEAPEPSGAAAGAGPDVTGEAPPGSAPPPAGVPAGAPAGGGGPDPGEGEAGAEGGLPVQINPADATANAPTQAPVSEPSLTGIGYTLAKVVLGMIAGVILLSATLVGCGEGARFGMLRAAFRDASGLVAEASVVPADTTAAPVTTGDADSATATPGSPTGATGATSERPETGSPEDLARLAQLERTADALRQLAGALQEERQDFRTFARGLIDLVLLNVLLPVLTALLGYIFGTRSAGSSTED